MMIFLLVAAALAGGTPLVAAVLVTFASLREDRAKSLAGEPPGLLTAAARRLLHAGVGGGCPQPAGRVVPLPVPRQLTVAPEPTDADALQPGTLHPDTLAC